MQRAETQRIALSNGWEFRPETSPEWQPVSIPSCWEQYGLPHDWEGIGWYRYPLTIEPAWREQFQRLWLRFGAVSYACEVFVNGQRVGAHFGAWDAFTFEITEAVGNANQAELTLRVLKSGGKTYPTNQTTAGFLPYVWGYLFGGLWQEVTLEGTGAYRLPDDLPLDRLDSLTLPAECELHTVIEENATALWSPQSPALQTVQVSLHTPNGTSDMVTVRTGKRVVSVEGSQILLNGHPTYPRMPLSWGWYPETLHCNPPKEVFRAELEKILSLGYNGIKACLWVPPPAFLDLCDEMGILVWLELPLWLPQMSAEQWELTFAEYEAIVQQVRHHPSIVIWTLGCELSAACSDEVLQRLYLRVKELTGSPLVRDNSGGGECYGGLLKEYADYYDYHFYCDLPFLRNTFDYFLPHWRTDLPWLFGEFCDADSFRDIVAIKEAHGGELPWWAVADRTRNPQGVRWDMHILGQWGFMEKHSLFEHREALKTGQQKQTLLHRKETVERVRAYPNMSGYVITGLCDTPISIAGMLDDFGEFRYTPDEFRPFNADTVLFLGWQRRRNWNAGGDRPSYIDTHCWQGGETLLPRLGISHYGEATRILSARFKLVDPSTGEVIAEVSVPIERAGLMGGAVQQVGFGELTLPQAEKMTRYELSAEARLENGEHIQNRWSVWAVPIPNWEALPQWAAYDPANLLTGLERHGATWEPLASPHEIADMESQVLFASRWTPEIGAFVERGGRVLLCVDRASGLSVFECPFWREAMKLFHAHPLWEGFAQEEWTDLQFYGLSPDCSLSQEHLQSLLPSLTWKPVLRRVDARTMDVTEYVTEGSHASGGKILLTTLRPHGGLGDQPDGLLRNIGGVQLLVSALRCL